MICTSQHSRHAGTSTILPKSKQKKFLSKSNFKILHDLDIKKLNFRSLKINEDHFAWHLIWYLISSKWSWFQASNWPFNLQKIEIKFLQLWHHQGCVIIFLLHRLKLRLRVEAQKQKLRLSRHFAEWRTLNYSHDWELIYNFVNDFTNNHVIHILIMSVWKLTACSACANH